MPATFDPDSFNGDFVSNRCRQCGNVWECYQTDPDFVCDECDPPAPEPEHPREHDGGTSDDGAAYAAGWVGMPW